jgi:molybdate transport system ATP-binding protein
VAGIVTPDEGRVVVGGQSYFDSSTALNVPIPQRRVGFVFQDYLLFPHLTAIQNVVYGMRSGSKKERNDRARDLLELLGIARVAERYPRALSGGEQQRVALARALASDPVILLLDEPLSAVDAATRSHLLQEMIEVQRKSAIPFLYVTHNPADAVQAGDWVLVLNQGRIVQEGVPLEVFNSPKTMALARAVGTENIFPGRVLHHNAGEGTSLVDLKGCQLVVRDAGLPAGAPVTIGVRSEDILVSREPIRQTSARNLLQGTIKTIMRDGEEMELVVACGTDFKVSVTKQAAAALGLAPDITVYLLIKASACHLLG